MKKSIALSFILLLALSLTLTAFVSCGKTEKQIPVYQGMTISSKASHSLSLQSAPVAPVLSGSVTDGNNGNHYGQLKGDHSGKNESIDKENPFPENNKNETVEEEIKSSLDVVGPVHQIYYATPGQDIYIHIHIDNPDSFEIMSFTLNGTKYSSYMFEEGSDMETIVLKYNVGDAHGIVSYTIDAIKYIDGTEIKDVIIEGDKTVKAGVKTDDQVSVKVEDLTIDTNSVSFNTKIEDKDQLVSLSDGILKAVLYDGETLIAEKDLAVGDNTVSFEGLDDNTVYQYAVVAYYDDLAGEGFGMHILKTDAFYTDATVLFDGINLTDTAIAFGYLWHESAKDGKITSLKLCHGETVTPLAADASTVGELLSNNTYSLIAEYENGGHTESITLEFTTYAKAKPEAVFSNPTKTQTSIGFDLAFTDPDTVGRLEKLELIRGEESVAADDLDARVFENLLSNNEYTVKATYTYDLNDGMGVQEGFTELKITTDAKAKPEAILSNPTKTQTSIGFDLAFTDPDTVGRLVKLELILGEESIAADNLDARVFENLLSNNKYTVKATYTYDLNDGKGEQEGFTELMASTDAKTAPEVVIDQVAAEIRDVFGSYTVTDIDSTLTSLTVSLYKGEDPVAENTEINFKNLDYYTDYTVSIHYTYDLNDGKAYEPVTVTKAVKTKPYLNVTSCKVINTSAVSEGETIYLQADIDNPLGIKVESVVVNGKTYAVAATSTAKKIYIEIVHNHQFAGGDTLLSIEKVNAKLDGNSYAVAPDSRLSDNVFINGRLELVKMEFVNENFEPITWTFAEPLRKYYCLFTFDNPTGYSIDKVTVREQSQTNYSQNLTQIDQNRYYLECTVSPYAFEFVTTLSLSEVEYSNPYLKKILSCDKTATIYLALPDGVHYIRTADDLLHMDKNYYYELANDIDLSGLEWRGGTLNGIFNGNGHTIKNMSFVGTVKSGLVSFGLFSTAAGLIENLTIQNATVLVTVQADREVHCGGIAAYGVQLSLYNCTVDSDSGFSVTTENGVGCYVGGLIGASFGCHIENCVNRSSVHGYYAGGIAANTTYATISNCSNYGDVTGYSAGGILSNCGQVDFIGCSNYGNINGQCAGGIVEGTDYSTITNCTNNGNVSGDEAGGIARSAYVSTIISCTNNGDVTGNYAAGIVNYAPSSTVTGCTNNGNVSGDEAGGIARSVNASAIISCTNNGDVTGYSAAGIVNYAQSSTVTGCANNGNVTASDCSAGIIVSANSSTFASCINNGTVSGPYAVGIAFNPHTETNVIHCLNTGAVIGEYTAGGVVHGNNDSVISGCINVGTVTAPSSSGIAPHYGDPVTNCFTLDSYCENDLTCTVEQLDSESFYTETLGWSEELWDFSELDAANGKYPKLK